MRGKGHLVFLIGVTFCSGIRFCEVNFAQAFGFWQYFTKKCIIFDKRVKNYLLPEHFQFLFSVP